MSLYYGDKKVKEQIKLEEGNRSRPAPQKPQTVSNNRVRVDNGMPSRPAPQPPVAQKGNASATAKK